MPVDYDYTKRQLKNREVQHAFDLPFNRYDTKIQNLDQENTYTLTKYESVKKLCVINELEISFSGQMMTGSKNLKTSSHKDLETQADEIVSVKVSTCS